MMEWQPPSSFEEYRLLRSLGRGAMGEVFLAHDTVLDRPVAVKFIASVMPDEAQRERFRTEARAVARVQHPNVVAIHRVGEVQHHPYLVSEFVRGESLERLSKPLPWQRVLSFGVSLARGLSAAHRRGVLHRDLKPANAILSEEGEVKLLDFGVAKLVDAVGGQAEPVTVAQAAAAPRQAPEGSLEDTSTLALTATVSSPPAVPSARIFTARAILPETGVVGTPYYMAPEIWRGEPATPRSDLYSLGVLLYELCSGTLPYPETTLQALREAVQHQAFIPLAQAAPQAAPSFASLVDWCLAREPAERPHSAEALREALEALEASIQSPSGPSEQPPYPGLHSFSAEDRAAFFGRAAEVRAVLDRLRAEPLVVVAGDSGAGKSSLCRAGAVPRVAEGALGLGGAWAVCELLPGRRPLGALAAVLAPVLGQTEQELLARAEQEPAALGRWLRAEGGSRGVLVFVDQLEELLTVAGAGEAERFAIALGALVSGGPRVRVLATVRGDFLARMVALPGLGELLPGGLYLLQHLSAAGLREAITAPARAQGFSFESEQLIEELITAGRGEGGLPLLQFALMELWERRDHERRVVPAAALRALGGVEGALARHADGVLAGLRPGQRDAARRLLLRLVLAEGTRARRTREELLGEGGGQEQEQARAALEALVHGRLVLAREASGEQGAPTYELAHEVLVRNWDTLRVWLAGNEEQRALRQRLERACAEWQRLGRTRELLWSGRQLEEAARLDEEVLSATEVAFLRDSRRAVRRRRLGFAAAILLPSLAAAGVYGGIELKAWQEREREVAHVLTLTAQAVARAKEEGQREAALRSGAFASFDAGRTEEAEQLWDQVNAVAAGQERTYAEAARALEAALLRDSHRPDVLRRLAEVLYERFLLAERYRHHELRDELKRRLEQVDGTREYLRFLEEPASLRLESLPSGAEVLLEQATEEGGRLSWSSRGSLGKTPLEAIELPPGSYRFTLQRPGRPPVYYPVLLRRGERYQARIPLPAFVPEGYVYVPPGRFLYGSAEEDSIRRNLVRAQPLHELETEGYLIGRTEVTHAEWIAFLRTLPPEERARRRPYGENYFGSIEVTERADGTWEFWLRRPGHTYRAREEEPVRYLERQHRSQQDWLRFPVSSISWDDSQAFLAWLDRSGRLSGARMCSEREWERAARGADGREYPHGNLLAPGDANFDATYGRKSLAFGPDEVGSHPASDSPFGVADMAGNVWEWMSSAFSPKVAAYGGGSFYQDTFTARSLNHADGEPRFRYPFIGLRVCAPPPGLKP